MNRARPEEPRQVSKPSGSGSPPRERGPENIQEDFLNRLRRERISVVIFLVNGVKLSGRIKSFDRFSLVLESEAQEQLIFKHAIASIVASRASPAADPTAGQHSGAQSRGGSDAQK